MIIKYSWIWNNTEIQRPIPKCPGWYDEENDITWSDTTPGEVDIKPCPRGSTGKVSCLFSKQIQTK